MARAQPRAPGVEARAGKFPGPSLIPALHAIQDRLGWLPREELVTLSREVHRPLYEIEGLISFYPHFLTKPPRKVTLHVCHDLSCWLQGADERIAALRERYGQDTEIDLAEVSCIGRCETAPAAAVNARAALASTPKYVICNADESEPGTFKDRQILAEQPHLVLEGMLLGMMAVGAEEGWVFIRHEYGPEEAAVRREIESLRAAGLLGEAVPAGKNGAGTGRRLCVEVFTSPGGYILGEESALIECMEGHRGEPRNKPPFPGVYGLWGQPTLMNSVETFAHVPIIVQRGADWWKRQGTGGSAGLKFFAVSGHVERPGVYCVPMGSTARQLLDRAGGVAGGRALGAIQPGGASSNFLGPDQLDVPLDFDTLAEAGSMLGSGALVVMAEGTDLLAAATNVLRFFRDESCGKCVPCRVGSSKAHRILSELLADGGGPADVDGRVIQLEETLRTTSICGLGQVALGPVVSVLGLPGGARAPRPDAGPGQRPAQATGGRSPGQPGDGPAGQESGDEA